MNGSVSVSVNIINRHASRNPSLDPRELTCERHVPPPPRGTSAAPQPGLRLPPPPASCTLPPAPCTPPAAPRTPPRAHGV